MTTSNTFGFTEYEARYLAPKRAKRSYLGIIVLLVLAVTIFHFTIEPTLGVQTAHAAQTPVLKTNADYCREWAAGEWIIVGATEAQMEELCMNYGVLQ